MSDVAVRPALSPRRAQPAVVTDRDRLVRQATLLARLGIGWHAVEATVAIGAGLVAGSIALVGFGADSLIEAVAGIVVLWRFAASRSSSVDAERTAQKLIAASFFVIASYVGFESVGNLVGGTHPAVSWVGVGLAGTTLLTMPPLAAAKARLGRRLGSSATTSEGRQNMLCAYLSAALLIGLGANALAGWWWADPVIGLVIAGVAINEGFSASRGEACCTATAQLRCEDECCALVSQGT